MPFVCLIRIDLRFPENGSLKGKRKELQSVKAQLHRRFGASVAETDYHDLWQRSELCAALVGREVGPLQASRNDLEQWIHSRFPDGSRVDGNLVSFGDVTDK